MHRPRPSPSSSSLTPSPSPRRPHHKRRSSALRLSTDTMTALPEYIPAARYHLGSVIHDQDPLDQPPDYPDSAEEADEDTDTEAVSANNSNSLFYVPQPPASPLARTQTTSPRRQKRFLPTHKRRPSFQPNPTSTSEPEPPPDPYLDALLARSVHALEMSNTLLQSSLSTHSSLSTLLAADSPGDAALERRARGLSSRIRGSSDSRAAWANDLEAITRDVEGLFDEDEAGDRKRAGVEISPRPTHSREPSAGVSASLPVDSGIASLSSLRGPRRRPSLDLRESPTSAGSSSSNWPSETTPRLVFTPQYRSNLIAPPPRAITQYVASSTGSDAILLPSTLGLRSPPSLHPAPNTNPYARSLSDLASSSTSSLLSATLPPQLTDRAPEPTTPAYNMLASFVVRPPSSGSNTPSSSFTHSFMRRRDSTSTTASNSTERGGKRRASPSPSPSLSCASSAHRRSRSQTPRAELRPMTPPAEESSPSPSSSDSCLARRTVQSLRKILDEQPAQPPKSLVAQGLRMPAFMPRTPAPVAQAGTSTATASVSRLFTKGTHSSSTRAPSPPRHSAMKRSTGSTPAGGTPTTVPSTPVLSTSASVGSISLFNSTSTQSTSASTSTSTSKHPSPTHLTLPQFVGRALSSSGGSGSSAPSSGHSTPKRISFAALPESYAASRPPDPKFMDKAAARKRRRKSRSGSSSANANEDDDNDKGAQGGWSGWLGGGLSTMGLGGGMGGAGGFGARHDEKVEDRMTRNWGRMSGGGGFSGGLDEWAV